MTTIVLPASGRPPAGRGLLVLGRLDAEFLELLDQLLAGRAVRSIANELGPLRPEALHPRQVVRAGRDDGVERRERFRKKLGHAVADQVDGQRRRAAAPGRDSCSARCRRAGSGPAGRRTYRASAAASWSSRYRSGIDFTSPESTSCIATSSPRPSMSMRVAAGVAIEPLAELGGAQGRCSRRR